MNHIKAMKQALEAIANSGDFLFNWHDCEPNNEREMSRYQDVLAMNEKAFNTLRTAIEQAEKQEPVALEEVYETIIYWDEGGGKRSRRELARRIVDLYTTPPAAPVQEPTTTDNNGGKTGWPPGLLKDDNSRLSKWFAGKPDARQKVREVAARRQWVGLTNEQRKAIAVCFTSGKVSVSEVQRKLVISYSTAQTLCQSIVDLGLADGLQIAPSLTRPAIEAMLREKNGGQA